MSSVKYPVMEAFYTIQGEGYYEGQAAYFIRLGGCDVGCVWCDVKDSWDASKHPTFTVEEIVEGALKFPGRLIVITGGEPCMHNLTPLTDALKLAGFTINIETSGAHPFSGQLDWICLSPKKFKFPLEENLPLANELKVVIFNISDFEWAEKHAAHVNEHCKLYLQPEWDKRNIVLPLIIDYIKENPKWTLSIQTHKYINVP